MVPVTYREAIKAAKALQSEDNQNPEYDRALRELIVDMYGPGRDVDESREIVQLTSTVVMEAQADRGDGSTWRFLASGT